MSYIRKININFYITRVFYVGIVLLLCAGKDQDSFVNQEIIDMLTEAKQSGIPSEILLEKINEGKVKKVNSVNIVKILHIEYERLKAAAVIINRFGIKPDKSNFVMFSDLIKTIDIDKANSLIETSLKNKQDLTCLKRNIDMVLILKNLDMPEDKIYTLTMTAAARPSINTKRNYYYIIQFVKNAYFYGYDWETIFKTVTDSIQENRLLKLKEETKRMINKDSFVEKNTIKQRHRVSHQSIPKGKTVNKK